MDNKRVNVGVIGVGNMGANHARVYSELKDANLVCISDLNEKQGAKIAKKYNCNFYPDYKDMLDQEEIEAVSIATPTKTHHSISSCSLKKRKHVLIEKPLCSKLQDAKSIVRLSRDLNVRLMVGHLERFNPAVRKMKELISAGALGRIISVNVKRVGPFPPQLNEGGVILDLGVHDIDVCNFLLEEKPHRVYAWGRKTLNGNNIDVASIFLEYEHTQVSIQTNWITPVKMRQLSITGTEGHAELDYVTQKLMLYESVNRESYDSFADFVAKFGNPKAVDVHIEKFEPLKAELKHFLKCVKNGQTPEVSGTEGINALEIAYRALKSCKSNKFWRNKGDL